MSLSLFLILLQCIHAFISVLKVFVVLYKYPGRFLTEKRFVPLRDSMCFSTGNGSILVEGNDGLFNVLIFK